MSTPFRSEDAPPPPSSLLLRGNSQRRLVSPTATTTAPDATVVQGALDAVHSNATDKKGD